jgi:hypothetical protein
MSPGEVRGHHSQWPLFLGLVALLAVGGASAALLVMHSSDGGRRAVAGTHRASRPGAEHPSSVSPTATSSTQSQQQAAENLARLLAQSVTDRSSIVSAVSDVLKCGPSLSQDAHFFESAATSRQHLLSRLANLPQRSALPGPMLQALTSAWAASVKADQDFAQWAQDEASKGCAQNDYSDPGYQAAAGPDKQATADKKVFVSRWNPIAAQYGLAPYKWDQL